MLIGCVRPEIVDPSRALRATSTPKLEDDLDQSSLVQVLEAQVSYFDKLPQTRTLQFGQRSITVRDYHDALLRLLNQARSLSKQELLEEIRRGFEFQEVYGDEDWGEVLVTSYFEPVIRGSLTPTEQFSRPLYSKPGDLLKLDLADFSEQAANIRESRGRIEGDRVIPYWTREEIDSQNVLKGRELELCWVDPIDAFFLHIQGSGTVLLPDGKEIYLNFADKNGRRYQAIAKFLRDKIEGRITMHSIVSYLHGLSRNIQDRYLFLNPSYVFFRLALQRAITALGIPATPGRTIATDSKLFTKGALGYLVFSKPTFSDALSAVPTSFERTGRIVVDQDTGGAITGPGRVDLFWGRGTDAGRYAGAINGEGRLYYLVPRSR